MNENTRGQNVASYDYKNVTVPHRMKAVYRDAYTNFGWEFCGTDFNITSPYTRGEIAIVLKFRRDHSMEHKEEFKNLEEQFDSIVQEIQKIEWKKAAGDMGKTMGLGILGSGFLVGAIFCFIGGSIPLGIFLLILSMSGWALGYFSYLQSQKKSAVKIAPKIDSQYDALHDLCEKGQVLLAGCAT